MKTSVLGIRLNDMQREKLKAIATDNRMGEVEVARLLIEGAISGKINVEKGHIVLNERC